MESTARLRSHKKKGRKSIVFWTVVGAVRGRSRKVDDKCADRRELSVAGWQRSETKPGDGRDYILRFGSRAEVSGKVT